MNHILGPTEHTLQWKSYWNWKIYVDEMAHKFIICNFDNILSKERLINSLNLVTPYGDIDIGQNCLR